VQGDERDVILFSVGYGPDKNGRVSMNFGPLNNTGGERRLNVAVSRARYEMMVFSTLQPEQIDLNRSRARGVEGLKRFLEYAKSGRMSLSSTQIQEETDTALVDAIANELRLHGYKVDTLVGRSRFKVDLAVVDPERPDQYLLGIICDGNNYYNTRTQRDREICQPGVLQGLGWNLMRVWTIDWFLNPEKVTDRILDLLDSIKSKGTPELKKGTNAPAAATAPKSGLLGNMGFTVEEGEVLEAPENDKEIPYKKANIPQRYTNKTQEVLALARRQVEQDIRDIIATEQPVTIGYLRKRIMSIYGQTRNTERLQHILEKGLAKAYVDPLSVPTNAAYWANAEAAKGYDKYRQVSGRDIEDIPLVEVRNVVLLAISQQLSLSIDDLLSQISRLLGFPRRTSKTKEAIYRVIEHLEREGKVRCEGDNIFTTDSTIH
jgi:very-short-patch-repair endonuclease